MSSWPKEERRLAVAGRILLNLHAKFVRNRKLLPSLGTTTFQNPTTGLGLVSRSKTMHLNPSLFFRLPRSFC